MKAERLTELYGLMRRTLEDRGINGVRERDMEDPVDPLALGQCHPVRRALRRIGVVHNKKAGRKVREEVEEMVWAMAEKSDVSVTEVGRTLLDFTGAADDGEQEGVCVSEPKCDVCHVREDCGHYVTKAPTIKDMPEYERPRERLLQLGQSALADAELLAILIGGGREEATAIDLARMLLARAGGLKQLAVMTPAELTEVSGIGDAKAARLLAAFALARRYAATPLSPGAQFTCSHDIFEHYHESLRDEKRETFACAFLDAKHRFIGEERISLGTLVSSPVNPREVFRPAIRSAAQCVVFVHNHPSGDPTPSTDDLATTRRLVEVGKTVGIRVLDHVIVGNNDYYSFADKSLL